ncbi:hypothetical protein [Hyphomicrobium sulfonivorans]|uniref:hypothetical protein n=1 Tax=Hyphomicrobium sulfonivorans TaxID=121290 RepID=UPI0015715149|nr:hypothetical protein [Hyphomicrobium sulfonivorans]MBI1650130.1 hypothetical protein [Hyphomicrobium sulfonivorans]NSL73045.1 hypothetical protein [Hyphomicrobium sulfonivorans]
MSKSIRDIKKVGRPKTTGTGTIIGARWHDAELSEIDDWRRNQEDIPTRAEAIRRLVRIALDSLSKKGKR